MECYPHSLRNVFRGSTRWMIPLGRSRNLRSQRRSGREPSASRGEQGEPCRHRGRGADHQARDIPARPRRWRGRGGTRRRTGSRTVALSGVRDCGVPAAGAGSAPGVRRGGYRRAAGVARLSFLVRGRRRRFESDPRGLQGYPSGFASRASPSRRNRLRAKQKVTAKYE